MAMVPPDIDGHKAEVQRFRRLLQVLSSSGRRIHLQPGTPNTAYQMRLEDGTPGRICTKALAPADRHQEGFHCSACRFRFQPDNASLIDLATRRAASDPARSPASSRACSTRMAISTQAFTVAFSRTLVVGLGLKVPGGKGPSRLSEYVGFSPTVLQAGVTSELRIEKSVIRSCNRHEPPSYRSMSQRINTRTTTLSCLRPTLDAGWSGRTDSDAHVVRPRSCKWEAGPQGPAFSCRASCDLHQQVSVLIQLLASAASFNASVQAEPLGYIRQAPCSPQVPSVEARAGSSEPGYHFADRLHAAVDVVLGGVLTTD